MGFIGPRKKFNDIFSHVGTIHQRVRQTDGHRTAAKTALLRIASRGKNDSQQNMTCSDTWRVDIRRKRYNVVVVLSDWHD